MKQLLLIDDDQALCYGLRRVFEREYQIESCETGDRALQLLGERAFDVALLDYRLGAENGLDVLARLRQHHPDLPVIFMTAYGTGDAIIRSSDLGADEYLAKPADPEQLASVIERLTSTQSPCHPDDLHLGSDEIDGSPGFIGNSPVVTRLLRSIPGIARTESPVLVTGESGTGKELIARLVHQYSHRADEPFIAVNCAAIPENLLESELFGYAKGAFSGAYQDKKGKFQLAHRGTLFLDEIGEFPLNLQPKLLRVLQNGLIEPLGATRAQQIDVRIIAATNRDVLQQATQGEFRQDLLFRLNVLNVELPPLRERPGDIAHLVRHFVSQSSRDLGRQICCVERQALDILERYSWPGNIRELRNCIQRALVFSRGRCLRAADVAFLERAATPAGNVPGEDDLHLLKILERQLPGASLEQMREHLERLVIASALARAQGNRSQCARELQVSRVTLNAKIDKYGIA